MFSRAALTTAFAALSVLLCFVPSAFAHEWQTFGDLIVLLHSDPDDNPIAREPARLYFYFRDADEAWRVETCGCVVSVSTRGAEIFSGVPMLLSDESYGSNVLALDYIYPARGAYTVRISGTTARNEPFELRYTARIERESERGTGRLFFWIVGAVLFLGLGAIIRAARW